MRLQYEIAAVQRGGAIKNALRGVEREILASNRRMASDAQRATAAAARSRGKATAELMAGPGRKEAAKSEALRHRQALANIRTEERAKIAATRATARASESLDRQRSRAMVAQFRAEERARERAERQALRNTALVSRARQERAAGLGRGIRRVAGGAAGAGALVLGGAAIAGGFAVGNAVAEGARIRRSASMLANQAGTPEIKDQLAKEALGVRGFSGEETLAAMSGFVTKTGDLTAARGAIQGLADLSLATGTDFGEMGEAAGQAFNVIRDTIKDPKEQLAALAEVMSTIAGQGNLGAVEIRDMATELAGLGAATRSFKGGPVELLKSMGAIAQASVARGGAKDAAEATTAVTRFAADVTKRPAQKALKGLGIDVFADKGKTQLKDPREIMADILAKTGGDMTQIEEVLNVESAKALRGFSPLFLEAERNRKATGQGPTGKEALFAEFQRFTGANLSPEEIQKRAASRLEDPDLQFSEAAKQFNEAVSKDLLPALTKLVPEFVKLTPALGDLFNAIARLLRLLPGQEVDPSTLPPEEAAMVKSARNTSLLEEVGHGLTFNLLRDKPSSFGLPSWLDGDDKPKLSPPGLPVPETPTRQAAPVTQEANKELAAFTSEVSKARKELAGFKVPASPDASRTAPIISPARN